MTGVTMTTSGSRRKTAASWEMSSGGKTGWSPWMLMTMSSGARWRSPAASARRSLPEGWSSRVMRARPPKDGDAIADAPIIGGHPDPVQILHLQGLLIGPLDQGLAQDQRQGFARKAGGAEAGGDDGDLFH